MHFLKGVLITLFAAVLVGGVYVSSMVLGWLLAILTVVALVISGVALVIHDLITTASESCKKPRRRR